MMRAQRGSHFDSSVLDCFLDAIEEVEEIRVGYMLAVPAAGRKGKATQAA